MCLPLERSFVLVRRKVPRSPYTLALVCTGPFFVDEAPSQSFDLFPVPRYGISCAWPAIWPSLSFWIVWLVTQDKFVGDILRGLKSFSWGNRRDFWRFWSWSTLYFEIFNSLHESCPLNRQSITQLQQNLSECVLKLLLAQSHPASACTDLIYKLKKKVFHKPRNSIFWPAMPKPRNSQTLPTILSWLLLEWCFKTN